MDMAGETTMSTELQEWTKERGILLKGSPPYAHSSNGKIEKAIQDNENKSIAMLAQSGLPIKLWGLAAEYAAYVH